MHRVVQHEIENVLANSGANASTARAHALAHLEQCPDCRAELSLLQRHSLALRQLRAPREIELEPRPGFYARVLERIEAEGPASIWNLFMESAFGRRIAVASLALAVLLGVYLISSERTADDPMIVPVIASQGSSQNGTSQNGLSQNAQQVDGAGEAVQVAAGREFAGDGWVQIDPGGVLASSAISSISMEQSSDDAVLSNLMSYREQ